MPLELKGDVVFTPTPNGEVGAKSNVLDEEQAITLHDSNATQRAAAIAVARKTVALNKLPWWRKLLETLLSPRLQI